MTNFIGTQMARIKFARDYFLVILNLITALSMLTLALEAVGIEVSLFLFIAIIILAMAVFWLVGFYIDKKGIVEADYSKMLENTVQGQVIIWKKIWKEVLKKDILELKKNV